MAGLLGHLSAEDKELIKAGKHPVIDSNWHVREEILKEPVKKKVKKKEKTK